MGKGRRRGAIVTALAGTALLAACGGASHPATASNGSGQLTARSVDLYARCIRSHGVPKFYFSHTSPGQNSTTPTLNFGPWSAPDPDTAQFQAAMKACNHLFPGGPPRPLTQQQKTQMLRFAACIRAHGYPSFPDPKFPSGGGVMGQKAIGIDVNSPRFEAAVKACNAKSLPRR